jgi:hypothetical protein
MPADVFAEAGCEVTPQTVIAPFPVPEEFDLSPTPGIWEDRPASMRRGSPDWRVARHLMKRTGWVDCDEGADEDPICQC